MLFCKFLQFEKTKNIIICSYSEGIIKYGKNENNFEILTTQRC